MSTPDMQNKRVKEAQRALKELGLPPKQQNTRTALVLLSMLDLRPDSFWKDSVQRTWGVTESMNWMAESYPDVKKGREDPRFYKPNSREAVRKNSIHQLCSAGILEANFDSPGRAVNSADYSYRPTNIALVALSQFDTPNWQQAVSEFHKNVGSLNLRWAAERERIRVPVNLPDGTMESLSGGRHSELIAAIVQDFVSEYIHDPEVLYIGDTGSKWVIKNDEDMRNIGIGVDPHGKMPDVLIHDKERDWLVCVEAYNSVGPMDAKRVEELKELLKGCRPGLVFVTAFPDKAKFRAAAADIAWETEVWIREAPTHLIHFNGERFLGPHEEKDHP